MRSLPSGTSVQLPVCLSPGNWRRCSSRPKRLERPKVTGVVDIENSLVRHSLATVLVTEEQVDPKTAQGILRHAKADVTMDIYTHAQDDAKRKALEKFEARLVR